MVGILAVVRIRPAHHSSTFDIVVVGVTPGASFERLVLSILRARILLPLIRPRVESHRNRYGRRGCVSGGFTARSDECAAACAFFSFDGTW